MIEINYNEYKETLAENMKLIVENNRLKEVEKEHQKLNGELREGIERLSNIINELEKSKEKQINEYEILILKIERYLNCYQYFLETQEENNKKIANMIHEFETKDSDKE